VSLNLDEAEVPPRKRTGLRATLITLGAILGVIAIGVAVVAIYLGTIARTWDEQTAKLAEEDTFPEETLRPPIIEDGDAANAVNILLLGSDTREAVGDDISDLPGGQRSDTIMVVNISGDRENVTVMSILRDSWVEVPGHGAAKINAALSWGGVPLTVQVVEGLIGARIDDVAIVDAESFKGLTDALGGVDINNPIAFQSTHVDHFFPQGMQHLDGELAMAYARERKAYADGDYQRVRNQQLFISSVMDTALSADTALNPGRVADIVGAVSPFVTVSEGLNAVAVGGLALEMTSIRKDDITFFTMPTSGIGVSADGQSIVLVDEARIPEMQEAWTEDQVADFAELVKSGG